MNLKVFEKLLRKCLQENIFTFNDKINEQIDGVNMGSQFSHIIQIFLLIILKQSL